MSKILLPPQAWGIYTKGTIIVKDTFTIKGRFKNWALVHFLNTGLALISDGHCTYPFLDLKYQ